MKLIRLLTDRSIHEGEEMPWGWGCAYRDVSMRNWVLAPIPFNFLAGWLRLAYFRLMEGPRDRLFAQWDKERGRETSNLYERAFRDGEKAAKQAVGKAFDDYLAESAARREKYAEGEP